MYVPVETISQSIYSHIQENSYYFNGFHSGDEDKLLSDIEEFYSTGIYDHDIVDVIMHAAAQALNLNIYTYQECGGYTKILKQLCGIRQVKCVCLKYSSDHYDAIVNASKGLVSDYLFTEQAEQANQQNSVGTPDETSSSSLVMQSNQAKM